MPADYTPGPAVLYHTVRWRGADYTSSSLNELCHQLAAAGAGPYDIVQFGRLRLAYLDFHRRYDIDWAAERALVWAAVRAGVPLHRSSLPPALPHGWLP